MNSNLGLQSVIDLANGGMAVRHGAENLMVAMADRSMHGAVNVHNRGRAWLC